jgi:hypothetical protein
MPFEQYWILPTMVGFNGKKLIYLQPKSVYECNLKIIIIFYDRSFLRNIILVADWASETS